MTDTALKQLIAVVDKIKILTSSEPYSTLVKARALPNEYAREVGSLRIDSGSAYGGRPSESQIKLADNLKKRMIEAERYRGWNERRVLLSKYASELEGLRAILPALAAKASVEIGITARGLEEESKGNFPFKAEQEQVTR